MLTDLHTHSNYSDGEHTPEEMIEAAIELGYQGLAITDHVWRTSPWIPAYAGHLQELKERYQSRIRIFTGIEAKVVDLDGNLDADPSFYAQVDWVLASFHRMPGRGGFFTGEEARRWREHDVVACWLEAFLNMLKHPEADIIAHPLSELSKYGIRLPLLAMEELAEAAARSGKIVELNVRYNTLADPFIQACIRRGVPMLVSSDSHSVEALRRHSALLKAYHARGLQTADIGAYLSGRRRG